MRLSYLQLTVCGFVFVGIAACGHANKDKQSLQSFTADPVDTITVKDITDDDLQVRQVAVADERPEDAWNALLDIEQLGGATPTNAADLSFDAVEGDHPCSGSGQGTDACKAASVAVIAAADQDNRGRGSVGELQTLTNRVIDPDTFDPDRTIDEIGRGGQLNSLASQALGLDFLTLPPVAPAVEEDTDTVSRQDLPPLVLDITVTQDGGT